MKYTLPTPVPGERYGETCDRLEATVKAIVESGDVSEEALVVLAYALMEAPSDLDYCSQYEPFQRSHKFLNGQSEVNRAFFKSECEKLPRRHDARINRLLSRSVTA